MGAEACGVLGVEKRVVTLLVEHVVKVLDGRRGARLGRLHIRSTSNQDSITLLQGHRRGGIDTYKHVGRARKAALADRANDGASRARFEQNASGEASMNDAGIKMG